MIEITNLIKELGIDIEYKLHIAEHLDAIKNDYHLKNGKWFDAAGRYAGTDPKDVCKRHRIDFEITRPYKYFAVSKNMALQVRDHRCVTATVYGTPIVGLVENGITEEELC